ncbi:MAG: hypothetical protein EXS13_07410 [Planctomycetes bacterium]|nr:hypothetical protein [Planctomycetota bacterium]
MAANRAEQHQCQPIVHTLCGPDRDGRLLVVRSESPAATLALLSMKNGAAQPSASGNQLRVPARHQ